MVGLRVVVGWELGINNSLATMVENVSVSAGVYAYVNMLNSFSGN